MKKEVKKKIGMGMKLFAAGVFLWLVLVSGAAEVQAEGEYEHPTVSVTYDGVYDYSAAADLYAMLNQYCQELGRERLIFDAELQKYAMQRAAEHALYNRASRPDSNGNSNDKFIPEKFHPVIEDGAVNYTAEEFKNYLLKTDIGGCLKYTKYNTVGIGCFEQEGQTAWSVCIGNGGTAATISRGRKSCTCRADVWPRNLNLVVAGASEDGEALAVGKTGCLLALNYNDEGAERGQEPFVLLLNARDFVWSYSDSSAVKHLSTEDEGCVIQPVKPGYVTVILTNDIYRYEQELPIAGDAFIETPVLLDTEPLSSGTVRITWYPAVNADGYRIYRRVPGGKWQNLKTINASRCVFDDSTATAGQPYYYTVRAYRKSSAGVLWSDYEEGIDGMIPVQIPMLQSVKIVSGKNIQIQWGKVPYATGYRVYRKTAGGKWQKLATVNAGVSAFIDKSADVNTEYLYTVRAYYKCSAGNVWSYFENGIGTRVPFETPKLSSAKAISGKRIQVSWKAVANATGYRVYRKTVGGSWQKIKTLTSGYTSYTDTTPVAGTKYLYTVRAYYTGSSGNIWSNFEPGISAVAVPPAPKLTGAKARAYNAITITWNKVDGASGYGIFRKGPEDKNWQGLTIVGSINNTYTDTTAVPGTKYTYTVRAYCSSEGKRLGGEYNKAGISATANLSKASTPSIAAASNHSNKLTWNKVDGATGYQVYCKVGKNGNYQRVNVTAGTSFTHAGLKKGTVYYYRVRAYRKVASNPNKYVYGAFSTEKYITAK